MTAGKTLLALQALFPCNRDMTRFLAPALGLAVLASIPAAAQQQLPVKVRGSGTTTDASGDVVRFGLNNDTIIDLCAPGGSTNGFELVYELDSDANGDALKVVDAESGATVCVPFLLYVPTINAVFDGHHVVVNSADGKQSKRLYYLFSNQVGTSVGTALVDKRFSFDRNGNTNRVSITAEFRFFRLPENGEGVKVCSGRLSVDHRIKSPAQ